MTDKLRQAWAVALRVAELHPLLERADSSVEPVEAEGVEPPKGEIWAYGPLVGSGDAAWLRDMGVAAFSSTDFRAVLAENDEVLVRINSPGGLVSEASVIQVALAEHAENGGTVNAIIEGMAHSAASLITLGMNGHIRIAELAESMIHLPWMLAIGGSKVLRKAADRIEPMEDRTVGQYVRRAKIGEDEMRKLLEEETFLTAAEAVRVGLADEVVEPVTRKRNKKGDGKMQAAARPGPANEPRMQAATTAAFL